MNCWHTTKNSPSVHPRASQHADKEKDSSRPPLPRRVALRSVTLMLAWADSKTCQLVPPTLLLSTVSNTPGNPSLASMPLQIRNFSFGW
jgi:hypothetical protein